jgi:hypothetical protein
VNHLGTVVADHPQEVAAERREAGAMTQQVAGGDRAGRIRVPQLKLGQDIDDRGVPADQALVNECSEGERRHRLGVRGQLEHRIDVDRGVVAQLTDPVSLDHHRLAVLDHRNRRPGYAQALHHFGNECVDCIRIEDCSGFRGGPASLGRPRQMWEGSRGGDGERRAAGVQDIASRKAIGQDPGICKGTSHEGAFLVMVDRLPAQR